MKIDLGKLKVHLERQRNYYSMFALLFLVVTSDSWEWWYLLIMIVLLPISVYIDSKYVLPAEFKYIWLKNPEYKNLLKIIKEEKE